MANPGGRPPKIGHKDVTEYNYRQATEPVLRRFLVLNGVSAVEYETLAEVIEAVGNVFQALKEPEIKRPEVDFQQLEQMEGEDLTKLIAEHLAKMSKKDQITRLRREIDQLPIDPHANQKIRIKIAALHPKLVGKVLQFAVNGRTCLIAAGNPQWVPVSKMFITGAIENAVEKGFDLVEKANQPSEKEYYETPQYTWRIHPNDMKYFPEYETEDVA